MTTQTSMLPFQLGEQRSFRGLTLVPLFPAEPLELENPLSDCVLLYEGEELVGAKQNRIVEQTILVDARSTLKIPAKCVERGRWSHRTQHFTPAPRAAY